MASTFREVLTEFSDFSWCLAERLICTHNTPRRRPPQLVPALRFSTVSGCQWRKKLQFSESSLDFCRSRAGLIREEQFTVIAVWPMHAMKVPTDSLGPDHPRLIPPLYQSRHGDMACETLYVDKQVLCARGTESEADGWARLNRRLTAHSEFTPRCCGRLISLSNEVDVEASQPYFLAT